MAVLKEYRCMAHDEPFEAFVEDGDKPECPHGCSAKYVVREFRTPIGIRHGGTTSTDQLTRQLAADFNMTDMRNDKDGSSVMSSTSTRSGGAKVYAPEQRAKWEPSLFAPSQGWASQGAPAPVFEHPKTMPGNKTGMKPLIDSMPKNLLRSKTVFQKPK
jgi:hypothetical protein